MANYRHLNSDILEKVREYISLYNEDGYFQRVKRLPSLVGIAKHIGVTRMTVNRWIKDTDDVAVEFAELIEEINDLQHECLVNSSLFDEINSKVAVVMLGKHGYSSRVENTLQGPNGGPVAVTSVSFVSAFDEDPDAV